MPSIDVHADAQLFSEQDERTLAAELSEAALRAEGREPSPLLLSKSWVFFYRHPASAVLAGDGSAATGAVRVSILAPPGRLTPEARTELVAAATRIVTRVVGDPEQKARTFVLVSEAGQGGWGLATTHGHDHTETAGTRIARPSRSPSRHGAGTSADYIDVARSMALIVRIATDSVARSYVSVAMISSSTVRERSTAARSLSSQAS